MALTESREIKNYISISADAKLRKVVPAGTPGAVERAYDTKEKEADGVTFKKATKIEKLYESVSGMIKDIAFIDTEFGTLLQVTVADSFLGDEEVLSMSTSKSYAQDFMKKLPNIKLDKEVILKPFAFTPEGGKRELKGLTVTQEGVKVEKSFAEKQGDVYVNTMGYPTPDAKLSNEKNEMKRKEGWKRYFKDVEIFLVDYTTEHFVTKKTETVESLADDMNASVEIPENF